MNKNLSYKEIVTGYEFISNGWHAETYSLSPTHVLRVSRSDIDGWRVLCYLSEKEREKFSLPRILRWWTDPNTDHLIAIVERLTHLKYLDYKDSSVNLEIFNRYRSPPNVDDVMDCNDIFYDTAKKAVELYHYCNRTGLNINALDLNYKNILKRANGQLILNDVLGSRVI